MPVLTILAVAVSVHTGIVALLTSRAYFRVTDNKAFAGSCPEIDPPLFLVASRHVSGLLSTFFWLVRWPSVTEVAMATCLVPFLFVPYPLILNNILEWVMYLIFGNAQGDGSHRDPVTGDPSTENGAPPFRWPPCNVLRDVYTAVSAAKVTVCSWAHMLWCRTWQRTGSLFNCDHSLLCHLQSESWGNMHHVDDDILQQFPTAAPNSRANAVMMARCATMAYDRWHNIDQTLRLKWNGFNATTLADVPGKYSLVTAWSFDRVTQPSKLENWQFPGPSRVVSQEMIAPFAGPNLLQRLQSKTQQALEWLTSGVLRGLQKIVWWLARAGEPDRPVYDEDEFTSINTDAFLMKAEATDPKTGGKVVALVLAFRGTEALQTVDWITDLAQAQPPPFALDPRFFPLGFTHQGFRDSLGLLRRLSPADDVPGFTSSYLLYEPLEFDPTQQYRPPTTTGGHLMPSRNAQPGHAGMPLRRVNANRPDLEKSPYKVMTKAITDAINTIKSDYGDKTTIKLFITGHSLGGALAHLYTGALLLREPQSPAAASLEAVYTFGEPCIGGQVFVTLTEDAIRAVRGQGGVRPEDRYKRVVNTLDIIARIPPHLGELYQHPGHCVFIKPYFALARPDLAPHLGVMPAAAAGAGPAVPAAAAGAGPAVPAAAAGAGPAVPAAAALVVAQNTAPIRDSSYSPVTNLIATPDIFLIPATLTAVGKLVLSALLLFSATVQRFGWCRTIPGVMLLAALFWPATLAVIIALIVVTSVVVMIGIPVFLIGLASYVLWPSLYLALIDPIFQQGALSWYLLKQSLTQPVDTQPILVTNPMYLITRLAAFPGPALLVLMIDLVFWYVTWWVVIPEAFLVCILLISLPPVIIGGLIDHTMAEYCTACWLSSEADWSTIVRR